MVRPATPSGRSGPSHAARQRVAIRGRDRPVHRRAAGIAPVQIGNDDLKRVERIVIDFPAHPASPDPAAARRLSLV